MQALTLPSLTLAPSIQSSTQTLAINPHIYLSLSTPPFLSFSRKRGDGESEREGAGEPAATAEYDSDPNPRHGDAYPIEDRDEQRDASLRAPRLSQHRWRHIRRAFRLFP